MRHAQRLLTTHGQASNYFRCGKHPMGERHLLDQDGEEIVNVANDLCT